MCGLVACLRPGAAINVGRGISLVSAAAERLRHRGPDGSGLRAVGHAVFGHRRLSIIDVARGGQPLLSEDGRIALVCNGEIYNHESLRARLEERHRFSSRSDSEVIVHLYEERGADCVTALDGMFAFVLTDGVGLLAARDPFGIKPLYMGRDGDGGLWFASEIKALVGGHAPRSRSSPRATCSRWKGACGDGSIRRGKSRSTIPPRSMRRPSHGDWDEPWRNGL